MEAQLEIEGGLWQKCQRLRLYVAQDRALEQFFKGLEQEVAEVAMKRHGHAKQLVVFFASSVTSQCGA
ncbi:hypothetical protein HaLaN_04359 [Haematococcus lacustris]|uniref:Uncharacterized protein n=1 Tax=Haematococcus lacustris TaxID=44745 RepID=A0A699Z1K0_HAELA|nr:hypothetical protein HaLaN_04359 [Haematococcus lacustris]